MKFMKTSVLCLAMLGVLVPPPALLIAAIPPTWEVTCEVDWTVDGRWNETIRNQYITVEFAVWTAMGPTYRTATVKVKDGYAITVIVLANGSHYGDDYISVAEIPFTEVRSEPPPSEATVLISAEYAVAWNSGVNHWGLLTLD